MKLLSLLLTILPLALAAKHLTSVVVSYPPDTPQSVIDRDMQDIIDAGGCISHEFHIFKGFSAKAPTDTLQSLSTLSTEYKPTIEEDQIVTAYDGQN